MTLDMLSSAHIHEAGEYRIWLTEEWRTHVNTPAGGSDIHGTCSSCPFLHPYPWAPADFQWLIPEGESADQVYVSVGEESHHSSNHLEATNAPLPPPFCAPLAAGM